MRTTDDTCPEGGHAGEEDIEHDADAPYVGLGPVLALEHLRRDVVGAADDVPEHLTFLEEDGEAEVGGLERRVLVLAQQQEVLGLDVPVHDPHGVARVHDLHDGAQQGRGGALRVLALGDDAVGELAAGAELHDEVDVVLVLVGAPEADDVGLAGEVVHDLHLAPDVVHVLPARQLPLRDGLARQLLPGGLVRAQVRDAELAAPQLLAHRERRAHVLHRTAQHRAHGGRRPDDARGAMFDSGSFSSAAGSFSLSSPMAAGRARCLLRGRAGRQASKGKRRLLLGLEIF
jgi:hypothetical protein